MRGNFVEIKHIKMKKTIEIPTIADTDFIPTGLTTSWFVNTQQALRHDMKIGDECMLPIPQHNTKNIVDHILTTLIREIEGFEDRFKIEVEGTALKLTRLV